MYKFTIDKDTYDELMIDKRMIRTLIDKHISIAEKLQINLDYYNGKHSILNRTKKYKNSSNNKVVCNHAKDISDTATGYFLGAPISYTTSDEDNEEGLDILTDAFDVAGVDEVDRDNGLDMSRFGLAYEYVYVKENETKPMSKNLDPRFTFVVRDDSIEENILFGVYYSIFKDDVNNKFKYKATVLTKNYKYEMILESNYPNITYATEEPEEHLLGNVPIIEILNNKDGIGDFEQQISLIDAYNTLMSDRINDKEQFVEALLVVYGVLMGDDNEEVSETMKILKENGLLELPGESKAEYIARIFDETGIETLRKAIKEDIYTFSHIPNLTDENFVGNSSGVAMEYKLLGLEMVTKTKERYYRKALRQRIELYCNYLNIKAIAVNPGSITATFTRSLPKNKLEISQMIANLKGTVSDETLLGQLDFVEDASVEIEKINKQNQDNIKFQQSMIGSNFNDNQPFSKDEDETEDTSSDNKAS